MAETRKSSDRISPKKLSDLKVVVLCIAAATTFWILNALNKDDYNTVVDFPIALVYDQDQYIPVSKTPKNLEIEISGNGWDLLRKYFNINNHPYPVELTNPSTNNFLLTSDLKRSLGDFLSPTQLMSILEDSLKFDIDKIESIKMKPVLDSSSYSLAKNYRLNGQLNIEPKTITLKGPSSILKEMNGVFKVQLDEQRINKNIDKKVSVSIPEEYRDLITANEAELEVKFDVVEFLEGNKRLKIKKINFPRTVSLQNEEVVIMISYLVDERKVSDLKELEFEANLDYFKRNKSDSTLSVQVKPMPSYLEQVMVEPSIVKLKYEK